MPLPVFENAHLLQSLGWAIGNSLWQTGILWLLYQLIVTVDTKLPAIARHHLSLVLLTTSFIWFIFTIQQNYLLLSNSPVATLLNNNWLSGLPSFNNLLPILSIIYLVLLCFYTTRFIKNLSVNRFLQTAGLAKAPIDFRLFVTKTALHLGIKKNIRVWLSDHVDVPCVTGFLKPIILLPAAIVSQLSIQQAEAILLHELAHIKRHDYLVNLIQSIVELILFFNPFAVLLSKAAKKERENCCDDWVMNFRYDQYEYAKALLALEEQRHLSHFRLALAATNGKKNLLQRVKRLFNTDPQTTFGLSQKFKLTGLCFLLLTGMFILLPSMIKKRIAEKTIVHRSEEIKVQAPDDNQIKENVAVDILKNQPAQFVKVSTQVPVFNKLKQRPSTEVQVNDYVNAYVNEELLNPASSPEPMISQVAEKETDESQFIVKIVEQQSGKKQTNTYYFELNNKNGNTAVKPLMMLNRVKASIKRTIPGNLPDDSLDTSTRPNNRKKITS
ncbi:MAG: M56 family metallopeptidase [Ferruginibacter sp.]